MATEPASSDGLDVSEADGARGMAECPGCLYCMRGLPPEGRCPECGFRYDAGTQVWRARRFERFAGPWLISLGVLLVLWSITGVFARPTAAQTQFAACVLVVWLFIAVRVVVAYYRRPFVAVTPDGVALRIGSPRIRVIPWTQVRNVRITTAAGRSFARVICEGESGSVDVSAALCEYAFGASDLKRAVEEHKSADRFAGVAAEEHAQ